MGGILIVGAHRSGTSWVARALTEAGVFFGDNLLGAELGNPYGHFEDIAVITAHDAALHDQEMTWKSTQTLDRPLGGQFLQSIDTSLDSRRSIDRPWALKDPRMCLFLPEWIEALPNARIIVVFRRPDEVIRSLHQRHAQRWVDTRHLDSSDIWFWESPDLALELWVHYNEQLLGAVGTVDPRDVHVVDWNDAASTAQLVHQVATKWNLGLSNGHTTRDPSLGQSAEQPAEVRDDALLQRAHVVWERLHELKRSTSSSLLGANARTEPPT